MPTSLIFLQTGLAQRSSANALLPEPMASKGSWNSGSKHIIGCNGDTGGHTRWDKEGLVERHESHASFRGAQEGDHVDETRLHRESETSQEMLAQTDDRHPHLLVGVACTACLAPSCPCAQVQGEEDQRASERQGHDKLIGGRATMLGSLSGGTDQGLARSTPTEPGEPNTRGEA